MLLVRSPSKMTGGRPRKAPFAAAAGAAIGAGACAGAMNAGAGTTTAAMTAGAGGAGGV